jgi:hypothetical protein
MLSNVSRNLYHLWGLFGMNGRVVVSLKWEVANGESAQTGAHFEQHHFDRIPVPKTFHPIL